MGPPNWSAGVPKGAANGAAMGVPMERGDSRARRGLATGVPMKGVAGVPAKGLAGGANPGTAP